MGLPKNKEKDYNLSWLYWGESTKKKDLEEGSSKFGSHKESYKDFLPPAGSRRALREDS